MDAPLFEEGRRQFHPFDPADIRVGRRAVIEYAHVEIGKLAALQIRLDDGRLIELRGAGEHVEPLRVGFRNDATRRPLPNTKSRP